MEPKFQRRHYSSTENSAHTVIDKLVQRAWPIHLVEVDDTTLAKKRSKRRSEKLSRGESANEQESVLLLSLSIGQPQN